MGGGDRVSTTAAGGGGFGWAICCGACGTTGGAADTGADVAGGIAGGGEALPCGNTGAGVEPDDAPAAMAPAGALLLASVCVAGTTAGANPRLPAASLISIRSSTCDEPISRKRASPFSAGVIATGAQLLGFSAVRYSSLS